MDADFAETLACAAPGIEVKLAISFDRMSSSGLKEVQHGLEYLQHVLAEVIGHREDPTANDWAPRWPLNNFLIPGFKLSQGNDLKRFRKLQDGFEYNFTTQTVSCMERLLARTDIDDHRCNSLLKLCMSVLRGAMLLHKASRKVFARQNPMDLLIFMLKDTGHSPSFRVDVIDTIVAATMGSPATMRTFEEREGVATMADMPGVLRGSGVVSVRILAVFNILLGQEEEARQTAISASQTWMEVNPLGQPTLLCGPRHHKLDERRRYLM
ncbi:hypothetical protein TWF696_003567 [Orbilia brochopaga]|uniref:Uncharacterized protein n=1 Tax=Orbilia brochopaga TaxID=3140254 RepID=A0AAV9U0C5_9PEZI